VVCPVAGRWTVRVEHAVADWRIGHRVRFTLSALRM
jgi:hypothetical protein